MIILNELAQDPFVFQIFEIGTATPWTPAGRLKGVNFSPVIYGVVETVVSQALCSAAVVIVIRSFMEIVFPAGRGPVPGLLQTNENRRAIWIGILTIVDDTRVVTPNREGQRGPRRSAQGRVRPALGESHSARRQCVDIRCANRHPRFIATEISRPPLIGKKKRILGWSLIESAG